MPRIVVKFVKYRIDGKGYLTAVDKVVDREFTEAMRQFLRAVVERVPLYTGMSRGSLLPLAHFLGIAGTVDVIGAKPRRGKSISEGIRRGREFSYKKVKGLYTFTFNNKVIHYRINEFQSFARAARQYVDGDGDIHILKRPMPLKGPPLPPWKSFQAGSRAFHKHMRGVIKKLPKVRKFLLSEKVSPGGVRK